MGKTNSEFKLLATAANYLKEEFVSTSSSWIGSPFEWVLTLPSSSKGALGKRLVYQWCALKNLAVDRSPDSDADMTVNGHRVEVKFSTLWKTGIYKFQQIRDQNYEYGIFLGVSPFKAHCWVISKDKLKKYVIGHMGQHTGSTGQETSWLTVVPDNPTEWLKSCGGTLEEAFVVLKSLKRRR